jgi:hypothetical protein
MAPRVTTFTSRLYGRLPEFYRTADLTQVGDLPLLRFLSLAGDEAGRVEDLAGRLDYLRPDELDAAGEFPITYSPTLISGGDYEAGVPPLGVAAVGPAVVALTDEDSLLGARSLRVTASADTAEAGFTHAPAPGVTIPAGDRGICGAWVKGPAGLSVTVECSALHPQTSTVLGGGGARTVELSGGWEWLESAPWALPVDTAGVDRWRPTLRLTAAGVLTADDVVLRADAATVRYEILPDPSTSDLVDPLRADVAWLPWLAQIVGARLARDLPVADQRATIAGAVGGWRAGTRHSIAAAAATALEGQRSVTLFDHFEGDPWRIGISTTPSETPSGAAVVEAVLRSGAKPAGVLIVHTFYSASWALLEATYPSWADIEEAGSWQRLESTAAP